VALLTSGPPPSDSPAPEPAGAGFGLYVHWPFCRAKCPYCDFNSHVAPIVEHERWANALVRELDHFAAMVERRPLTSVFFGGGTPSLMAPATVGALLERAELLFGFDDGIEITLEANPTSVEAARLRAFRAAGVNRVSLGVQALDDAALRALGREHSAAEALRAVDLAAALFERFSFDLIYARPGQTLAAWQTELDRAIGHAGGHLSVYQLTIEPGTRYDVLQRQGRLTPPDDDLQADLYEYTQARLEAAGLPAYEISNHARPGEACRHNLTYWRYGDYVGIGPGAHGQIATSEGRSATETARMPRTWLARVERAGHAEMPRVELSVADQILEMLLMGLRLAEGVELERLAAAAGAPSDELLPRQVALDLVAEGLLERTPDRLRATAAGRQRLNVVLARLTDRIVLPPPLPVVDRKSSPEIGLRHAGIG
jgi:putative oxygen-independent coproporphyrinogen III oxidase